VISISLPSFISIISPSVILVAAFDSSLMMRGSFNFELMFSMTPRTKSAVSMLLL
jgi:hypothetical protein